MGWGECTTVQCKEEEERIWGRVTSVRAARTYTTHKQHVNEINFFLVTSSCNNRTYYKQRTYIRWVIQSTILFCRPH